MSLVALTIAMTAQYAAPQGTIYSMPPQTYAAPPQTYVAPPQAYELVQPGPFGRFLGTVGEGLIRHSWPRLRPVRTVRAQPALIYLAVQQAAPQAPDMMMMQAPPPRPAQTYGSPQVAQAPLAAAQPGPSEAAPPMPAR